MAVMEQLSYPIRIMYGVIKIKRYRVGKTSLNTVTGEITGPIIQVPQRSNQLITAANSKIFHFIENEQFLIFLVKMDLIIALEKNCFIVRSWFWLHLSSWERTKCFVTIELFESTMTIFFKLHFQITFYKIIENGLFSTNSKITELALVYSWLTNSETRCKYSPKLTRYSFGSFAELKISDLKSQIF